MGKGGGMKGGMTKGIDAQMGYAPQPAPVIQYVDPNADANAKEAKLKAEKAALLMKGRQSTVLTPDKLGQVAIDKRTALGA